MSVTHIQQSIENVTNYLSEHPELDFVHCFISNRQPW